MFTRTTKPAEAKAETKQDVPAKRQRAGSSDRHIVRHGCVPQPPQARRKARRKGGWKATRYLDHDQFKRGFSDAVSLCRAGYRFSIFVSLMPPDDVQPDAERIRWIDQKLSRVGQALKRRGQPDVRIKTLEKKIGGRLHSHALIHVLPQNFDVIERMFDAFDKSRGIDFADVDVDEAQSVPAHAAAIGETQDDLLNAILYALKQHRWAGPGHDGSGSARRFWIEGGDPIKGQRLSLSNGAKAILAGGVVKQPAVTKHAPAVAIAAPVAVPEPVASSPQIEPVQLALFDANALPKISVIRLVEEKRRQEGLPQHVVAARLGVRQPHYANASRGHDRLGAWRRNRALEYLAA